MDIDTRQLKKILQLIAGSDVMELELEQGGEKIRIVRNLQIEPRPDYTIQESMIVRETKASKLQSARDDGFTEIGNENRHTVSAPIVGTFYRAPAPGARPFVEEGDEVVKGKTLCIIEAMKLMNEIESDVNGRIVSILCDDGRPVEYGMPLMLIELSN